MPLENRMGSIPVMLLLLLLLPARVWTAPASGQDSIHRDDPSLCAWANSCRLERGPGILSHPDSIEVIQGDSSHATGKADGLVVSLGDRGKATLGFPEPISDHPGPDLAVFENSFDGNFLELAVVEVSSDGRRYVRFPALSETQTITQVPGFGNLDNELLHNLAGKYSAEWGTLFDLSDLRDSSGLDINHISSVRIIDVVGFLDDSLGTRDAYGNLINDPYPTPFESGGFDLDAVGIICHTARIIPYGDRTCLYPNPCTECIFLEAPAGRSWSIYDMKGKLLDSGQKGPGPERIDIHQLPAGIYLLRTTGPSASQSMKFCKTAEPYRGW